MGVFLEATEMKAKTLVPLVKTLELEDLDDLFIIPAERMIAEACVLNLDTNGHPWRWRGRFESTVNNGPRLLAEYLDDYRMAVIAQVNHMAAKSPGVNSISAKGAVAQFSTAAMAPTVRSIMKKWSGTRRIFRT